MWQRRSHWMLYRPSGIGLGRWMFDVGCSAFSSFQRHTSRDDGRLVILSSVNNSYQPIELPASEVAWIYPVKQVIRNY
jgi:hypothetical protein